MSNDSQDRALTLSMRRVLAFAKEQMPESIICIMSFTHSDETPGLAFNKIATNTTARDVLCEEITKLASNFTTAEVFDLTDTGGTIQ